VQPLFTRGGRKVVPSDWTSGASEVRDSLPSTLRCTRGFRGNPAFPCVCGCVPPLTKAGGPCQTLGESPGRDKPSVDVMGGSSRPRFPELSVGPRHGRAGGRAIFSDPVGPAEALPVFPPHTFPLRPEFAGVCCAQSASLLARSFASGCALWKIRS
jgi:hypothetical protein